jgi:predicted Zn-dependent protease
MQALLAVLPTSRCLVLPDAHQPYVAATQAVFMGMADLLPTLVLPHEHLEVYLRAESSDFVRINGAKVRQTGLVQRMVARVRLINPVAQTSVIAHLTLNADAPASMRALSNQLAELRGLMALQRPDPHLAFQTHSWHSETLLHGDCASPHDVAQWLGAVPANTDLVGLFSSGVMMCAFLSSNHTRLWHSSSRWCLDASVYAKPPAAPDKAVKFQVAGSAWHTKSSPQDIQRAIQQAIEQAHILCQPELVLKPDDYRVWLAPLASAELLGMLCWGGFSASSLYSGQSTLKKLYDQEVRLHQQVSVFEDLAVGQAPLFDDQGYQRAARLPLITHGQTDQPLINQRSAKEFGLVANGAAQSESPQNLVMAEGKLDEGSAMAALGTGLWISNLWYLNFSARSAARVTGMTRFASLWVENGVAVAPIKPMRFDDSLFDLLGDQLEAIGATCHWIVDTDTYDWRSFGAGQVPGLLIKQMRFTL